MNDLSDRLKFAIGSVTIVAFLMLVFLVAMFPGLPTLGTYNRYTVTFQDAPGVVRDTPVRRSGVKIGSVESVALDDESGEVKVVVKIDRQYTIRKNLQPVISKGLLASDTNIDFVPAELLGPPPPADEPGKPAGAKDANGARGPAAPKPGTPKKAGDADPADDLDEEQQPPPGMPSPPVAPGSEIRGREAAELGRVLNRTSELVPETRATLEEMRRALRLFDRVVPQAERTLREFRDLARDARKTLPTVDETARQYRDLATGLRRALPAAEDALKQVRDLAAEARQSLPGLNDALKKYSDLAADVRKLVPGLDDGIKQVRDLAAEVRKSVSALDDALKQYRDLAADVRKSVPALDQVLKQYRDLGAEAQKVIPTLDETLKQYRDLGIDSRKTLPVLNDALKQYRDLAEEARKALPSLDDFLKQFAGLAKDSREALPALRRTNDEVQATTKTFGQLGERLNLLVQTNQETFVKSLENLGEALKRLVNLLSQENQRNVTASLQNLKTGTDRLPSAVANADDLLKDGKQTSAKLREIAGQAQSVVTNLQATTKPLAERTDPLTKNALEAAEKINRLTDGLQSQLAGLTGGDGTVRRLLNDPGLYQSLDAALGQINLTLPRLDRALRDVEVFADKIARHPELLGAGGIVSPSKGLKDAPATLPPVGPSWGRPAGR